MKKSRTLAALFSTATSSSYEAFITIIGMPPHIIMQGIPMLIMFIIIDMRSFITSI